MNAPRAAPASTAYGRLDVDLTGVGIDVSWEPDPDDRAVRLIIRTSILGTDHAGETLTIRMDRGKARKFFGVDLPLRHKWESLHGDTSPADGIAEADLA